jgi:hypothetical protein
MNFVIFFFQKDLIAKKLVYDYDLRQGHQLHTAEGLDSNTCDQYYKNNLLSD